MLVSLFFPGATPGFATVFAFDAPLVWGYMKQGMGCFPTSESRRRIGRMAWLAVLFAVGAGLDAGEKIVFSGRTDSGFRMGGTFFRGPLLQPLVAETGPGNSPGSDLLYVPPQSREQLARSSKRRKDDRNWLFKDADELRREITEDSEEEQREDALEFKEEEDAEMRFIKRRLNSARDDAREEDRFMTESRRRDRFERDNPLTGETNRFDAASGITEPATDDFMGAGPRPDSLVNDPGAVLDPGAPSELGSLKVKGVDRQSLNDGLAGRADQLKAMLNPGLSSGSSPIPGFGNDGLFNHPIGPSGSESLDGQSAFGNLKTPSALDPGDFGVRTPEVPAMAPARPEREVEPINRRSPAIIPIPKRKR